MRVEVDLVRDTIDQCDKMVWHRTLGTMHASRAQPEEFTQQPAQLLEKDIHYTVSYSYPGLAAVETFRRLGDSVKPPLNLPARPTANSPWQFPHVVLTVDIHYVSSRVAPYPQ